MEKSEISNVNLSVTRLIAIFIILFFGLGPVLTSGFLAAFIDIPSMAVTFGLTAALLLFNFGADFIAFIPRSFVMLYTKTPTGNKRFAEIAYYGSRYAIGAGGFGTCLGLVLMLQDLSDASKIGTGMAVSFLTFIYGLIAAEFFFVPLHRAYSENPGSTEVKPAFPTKHLLYGGCVIIFMLASFFIMLLVFSTPSSENKTEAVIRTGYEIELPQIVFNPAGEMRTKMAWLSIVATTHNYEVTRLFKRDNVYEVYVTNRIQAKILDEVSKLTAEEITDPSGRKSLVQKFKEIISAEIDLYSDLLGEDAIVEKVLINEFVVR